MLENKGKCLNTRRIANSIKVQTRHRGQPISSGLLICVFVQAFGDAFEFTQVAVHFLYYIAVLAIGLQSCSKPNPESMSEIVLETISIYKSGGDYLGYIESLEKKYKCVDYKDSLKLEISSDTKIVRKMFTSEDEKVKVRLTGTEDSDWRDLEFIIYPLTECYKEIKEKAKEHNVFYYSLYLYRYEVPNSVGKIKVDDVETPFFKGLRFYNKKQ